MDGIRIQHLALIALAGGAGTLARYGLSTTVMQRWAGTGFPWGTVVVNLAGCFLFGLVWSLAVEHAWIGAEARAVLLIGFMGGFTTFSSFGFETFTLLRDAQWGRAAANVLIQNLCGILFLWLGVTATKLVR